MMAMLSATERSGTSDSSWKMQTMPGARCGGGRGEGDLGAVEHDAAGVRPDHARQDLDQRRLAGAVLAENGMDAPAETASSAFSSARTPP